MHPVGEEVQQVQGAQGVAQEDQEAGNEGPGEVGVLAWTDPEPAQVQGGPLVDREWIVRSGQRERQRQRDDRDRHRDVAGRDAGHDQGHQGDAEDDPEHLGDADPSGHRAALVDRYPVGHGRAQ